MHDMFIAVAIVEVVVIALLMVRLALGPSVSDRIRMSTFVSRKGISIGRCATRPQRRGMSEARS